LKHQGVVFPEDVTVYYPMNLESSSTLRCFTSFNIFSLPVGTEGMVRNFVSSCSNTGSIRDDPYWISRKNSLELIELSNINKVSLV
jgi:hypothetical protein